MKRFKDLDFKDSESTCLELDNGIEIIVTRYQYLYEGNYSYEINVYPEFIHLNDDDLVDLTIEGVESIMFMLQGMGGTFEN